MKRLVLYLGSVAIIVLRSLRQHALSTIVTILSDSGTRYQSKLWNPAFLEEKGLPVPDWLEG